MLHVEVLLKSLVIGGLAMGGLYVLLGLVFLSIGVNIFRSSSSSSNSSGSHHDGAGGDFGKDDGYGDGFSCGGGGGGD
ncbi:hypothetical protein [Streptomyces sp. NPDC048248]|uniref:hypothetical protein n=1 Tax=Streptomyces sp. NPDC048248 TaxID=3365523 RepID=UPI00371D3174